MKSKLLVLALSMFAMSFVAADDIVDAKSLLANGAAVEVNADEEEVAVSDTAKKEVAEAKAKKAEETKADQNSCKSCK